MARVPIVGSVESRGWMHSKSCGNAVIMQQQKKRYHYLLPFMFYMDCGNICLGLVWGHVMVFGAILQYALSPSHLVHSVASIVLRVPSGWPASSWHGLGRWGLGGIGELIFFCMCWALCEFCNIFSLGNSRLRLWPNLVRAALQGQGHNTINLPMHATLGHLLMLWIYCYFPS